ncbi:MAG: 2OG-Fe(II) oxygenase [Deltaproteobacteria bacterium]|nr:2OG-Fe(II) oxygenase [Deltaproteobacteria bacterium]
MVEPTYQVCPTCTFRVDSPSTVEVIVEPGASPRRIPADLASFLLQLGTPRTVRQIHERSGTQTSLAEMTRVLERLCAQGLLVQEGADEPTPSLSLATQLRSDVFGDPQTVAQLGEHLRQGRLLVIRDALPLELAERVHAELDAHQRWSTDEAHAPYFTYRGHKISDRSQFPPSVADSAALFGSPSSKDFISTLSGLPCDGETLTVPSWFQPGDHISPHQDSGDGRRAVAYIWHLTKNWDEGWGGEFAWYPTGTLVKPAFNRLLLFAVNHGDADPPDSSSLHSVPVVATRAREKRLAVGGWWHRKGAARQRTPPVEASRPGDLGLSHHRYGSPRVYVGNDDGVTVV